MGSARSKRLERLLVGGGWLALATAGCGSSDGGDAGDGASKSGARAALTIDVSGDVSQGCPRFVAKVPPVAGTDETVTEATYAAMIEDGRDGARVACRVVPKGGAYDVAATVVGGPWELELATAIAAERDDTAASVSLTDTDLKATWSSPAGAGCTVSAHADGSNLAVAPGRLWASVTCPAFVDPANASARCAASGYVLLDGCER